MPLVWINATKAVWFDQNFWNKLLFLFSVFVSHVDLIFSINIQERFGADCSGCSLICILEDASWLKFSEIGCSLKNWSEKIDRIVNSVTKDRRFQSYLVLGDLGFRRSRVTTFNHWSWESLLIRLSILIFSKWLCFVFLDFDTCFITF